MENMEYYTQRLQCSDEEKDACLETVAKLYRLRYLIRREGILMAETLAEEEPDPFFRACLLDLVEAFSDPEKLERRFTQYLMAGDYRGSSFLNAVLISQGFVLLARYEYGGEDFGGKDWEELLGEALRGWFGVEYREKVMVVIKREEKTRRNAEPKQELDPVIWSPEPGEDHASLLREFDGLMELTPPQRDWLVRNTSTLILCLAMQAGGTQVNEYLREGVEDREQLEKGLNLTTKNVLYTGDFRTSEKAVSAARELLGEGQKLDLLITEGTNIRPGKEGQTGRFQGEAWIQHRVTGWLRVHQGPGTIFVLCSSANEDRIHAFTRVVERFCRTVCEDLFQSAVRGHMDENIQRFVANPVEKGSRAWPYFETLYQQKALVGAETLARLPGQKLIFVRTSMLPFMERYMAARPPEEEPHPLFFYSMWEGYYFREKS